MRTLLAALLTAAIAWGPLPAQAAPPAQAALLCSGAPRGCGITISDATREGATFPVTVHGRPQTRVKVLAYQALVDEHGTLQRLLPIGEGVEVLTGAEGVVSTDLSIPAVVREPSSGWALISVDGVTGIDTSLTVGAYVPFGARRVTVLGDGFAERKPVGRVLELSLVGAIRGSRFAVEYRADDGAWRDITVGDGAAMGRPDEPSAVQYQLPRGLTGTPHQIRLRNTSDSAIAALWLAVPSDHGEPAPVRPLFTPPPVGDALTGTSTLAAHPAGLVRAASYGIAAGSLAFVAGAVAWSGARPGGRRR